MNQKTRYLTHGALLAALYVALTYLQNFLIPGSALGGAVLLLVADVASRVILPPTVLPIGALTSFLGAPLFLYLCMKGGNKK